MNFFNHKIALLGLSALSFITASPLVARNVTAIPRNLLSSWDDFSGLFGPEHNLIAIDPRGIGNSAESDFFDCLKMESAPSCDAGYANTVAVAQDLLHFVDVNAIAWDYSPSA
ncbi:hypothetical protein EJ02DRAFT_422165 [Clathrospora elynae]|uniref:AB hydrolase-1 domain-containing protein n=1 Tax=Clathrospora elynae TaxID=706981 RepID=A0A6A5SZR5_9PLEO|nr:hypothetical protein EJ02DRAFT_422165 [Clathrospora elynae]